MGQGLQVWNAAGALIIDTSSFVVKTGIVDVGTVTAAGSTDISAIQALGGTITPIVDSGGYSMAPDVTISGSTLSWAARGGASFSARIRVEIQ